MPEITCPECAYVSDLVAIRRSGDDFCTHCDYPLFWAPTAETRPDDNPAPRLGRLPGVSGRGQGISRECSECYEPNPLSEPFCTRCGREFDAPQVQPEPLETPAPLDVVEPHQVPPESARPLHEPPANSMWNPLSAGLASLSAILAVILTLVALL
jgi:hypothetical protein